MLRNILVRLSGLLLIFGLPFCLFGIPALSQGQGVDAISGASMISAKDVSGEYVVLLNKDRHVRSAEDWMAFFQGESPLIFDDLICYAASSDGGGIEYAGLCQARLPENQMTIKKLNGMVMISKLQYGILDGAVMSEEFAEKHQLKAESLPENIMVITIGGDEKP